jgi:hypothetical protein
MAAVAAKKYSLRMTKLPMHEISKARWRGAYLSITQVVPRNQEDATGEPRMLVECILRREPLW